MLNKELRKFIESQGFSLVRQKKHFVFKHDSGIVFTCSKTCSDYRAIRNVKRDIRKLLEENNRRK